MAKQKNYLSGREIKAMIDDLRDLVHAYRNGEIKEIY